MSTAAPLSRGLSFFQRFLRDPRHVGAVLPSTRYLGEAMTRDLSLASGDLVVEYGPGTGSLTTSIADALARASGNHYLGIELQSEFCRILRERFPQLMFHHGNVQDVQRILADKGLPPPRAILSGLPLILLPAMEEIVLSAARVLAPGGVFRTFSYLQSYPLPSAGRLRRCMREQFETFEVRPLVLRNFPPAFVLHGQK